MKTRRSAGQESVALAVRNIFTPCMPFRRWSAIPARYFTGNLEISAVVLHFRQQRERTFVLPAVGIHPDLRQTVAQQAPAGHPVCELAGERLQRQVHVVHDVRIQTDAGHEQEMPRRAPAAACRAAERDAPRPALLQALGRALQPRAQLHFHRQYVGRAAGEDAEGNLGKHHAFGGLVDGAVAAGHHHQVRSVGYVFAHDAARRSGSRSRGDRHVVTVALQDFHNPPDKRAAFSCEFARTGIVD